ncbi:MAG: hypothetical protein NUV56_04645 [Candidatus Uhrbacteria bacterium]|nr:hypothetical protein [Candidatus Uhrbacteria bacterium]
MLRHHDYVVPRNDENVIIEVVPLIKLPRRFSVFDYEAPDGICIGDVVRTTFRGRPIVAIVTKCKKTSSSKRLVAIDSVVDHKLVSQHDIDRLFMIADTFVQSASAIFSQAILLAPETPVSFATPRRTASIETNKLADMRETVTAWKDGTSTFQLSLDDGLLLTLAARKNSQHQMLILVPRERDVDVVAQSLPLGKNVAIWHGHIPERKRAELATAWRTGKIATLIGTRQASLLPAHRLSSVVILEAGNEEHASTRRNPRFDARYAARLLTAQHKAKLASIDVLPRPEDVVEHVTRFISWKRPKLIDLTQAAERSKTALISATLEEEIKTALQSQKNVLLFMNRKGVAKRLQCASCGHVPFCGTCGNLPTVRVDDLVCDKCGAEMWLPKACPACRSPKIGMRGIGGARLEHDLANVFPEATVARIEKGHTSTEANILLVTEFYFSNVVAPFTPNLGLVADVIADIGFVTDDFRSAERVARKIARLQALAHDHRAECLIQTYAKAAIDPLIDGETFTQKECAERERYGLPPYSTIVTLKEKDSERQIRIKPDDLADELLKLQSLPDSTTIMLDNPL